MSKPEGIDTGTLRSIRRNWNQLREDMGPGDRARLVIVGQVDRDAERGLHLGAGVELDAGVVTAVVEGVAAKGDVKRAVEAKGSSRAIWVLDLEAVGAPQKGG